MKQVNSLKAVFTVFCALICSIPAMAQLSGSYTIGGTSPDYSTLSAALSDLNSLGVNGPVVFNIRDGNYSGSSWRGTIGNISGASATNTITFQSQSGNRSNCTLSPSGSSSANYVFYLNGAKYVTIKDLTLNNTSSSYGTDIRIAGAASNNTIQNCVLTGNTSNSTSTNKSRVYGTSLASATNITFKNNLIDRGSYGVYWWGNNTSSTSNGHVFEGNEFNQNYYYAFYGYYMGDLTLEGNTMNRTGGGSFYGWSFYYTANNFFFKDNVINTHTTSTSYITRVYYTNYYSNNKDNGLRMTGNVYNVQLNTNTVYVSYHYGNRFGYFANNTMNVNSTSTSGYIRNYFNYYGYDCLTENNTFNFNKSGGYIYNYIFYYGQNDTFRNNTINETGNCYTYNYMPYRVENYVCTGNEVNVKTSNRTCYNYLYYYTGIYANNKIKMENSSSGTLYGLYILYQQSGSKIFNNTIDVKSTSSCYGVYMQYNYSGSKFFNNTIYNRGTSSSSHGIYVYNTSSSYGGDINNNIIYKTSGNGYGFYAYNSNYIKSDYNIYYKPSGNYFYRSSSSYTSDNLHNWRGKTGLEKNSLIYAVPFNDAANGDFSIDASSPNAWAVNGRGIHDTVASLDMAGNPRAGIPQDGVPDLGAYEVVPTSTPPYANAYPSAPVANSDQVFVFAQDTVGTIQWGANVPSSFDMRQYTGVQAGPIPAGVGRMFFYTTATTPGFEYSHVPLIRYKEPWIGDVSSEQNAVIARSSNGGAWEGYNYTNAATNTNLNYVAPTNSLDSVGAYTAVENGRIGIRCVENPKGIAVSNITAFAADIEWDPVFNPIGYQVIVKKNPVPPTDADWGNSVLATSNSHSALGLDEDSTYYVFIRSICGVKDTSGYSVDSFTTLITCHNPDVQLTAQNNSRVISYWGTVKTAYKYEYALTTSATPPAAGTDITKTSMLEPYLNDGTKYWVHVKAHCSSIYPTSQWSSVPFETWATSVANVNGQESGLNVYPNPARNEVSISIGGVREGNGTILLVDMTGKVLKRADVSGKSGHVMNISELPSGVYILQYSDDERQEMVKFEKQ